MAAGNESVNPPMIVLARESRGLTQSALAEISGISQGHLSKMEGGLFLVNHLHLESLAQALRYPPSFFSQSAPLYGPGINEFYHRKRQSLSNTTLKQVHAKINILLIHLAKLLQGADIGDCSIVRTDARLSPPEAARAVRAMWHLPPGPIANLTQAIEAAGGIVVRFSFGTPLIDGISRWVPGLPPVFFINDESPMDRARLTLAHELGHMVLHDSPRPEMEDEANAFAAELLMPAREIRPSLQTVNLARLAALKPFWKVSMGALLHRATDLNNVSDRMKRHLWMTMSKYRRREPPELDVPVEEPQLLAEILKLYREHFSYSLGELAELLAIELEDLRSLYKLASDSPKRAHIRLVK